MTDDIVPFRIAIADPELEDLRERLDQTRWPAAETVDDWTQGVPRHLVQELCRYWAHSYDWRATESRIGALPQFTTAIDGLDIHFLHAQSARPDARPLILTHGWPGTFLEFEHLIEPLTAPSDPNLPAFSLVIPSLPGYGFSGAPMTTGWGVERIAEHLGRTDGAPRLPQLRSSRQ